MLDRRSLLLVTFGSLLSSATNMFGACRSSRSMPDARRIYLDNAATSFPKPEAVFAAVESRGGAVV